MTSIPNDPVGKSGLVQTIKNILRLLREQRVYADSRELRIDRTSQGTKISLVPDTKGKGGSSGGSLARWG